MEKVYFLTFRNYMLKNFELKEGVFTSLEKAQQFIGHKGNLKKYDFVTIWF